MFSLPCLQAARSLVFFLTALPVVLFCAASATAGDPFLSAAGNNIRDDHGRGDIVFLRGVNLGGWLLMEGCWGGDANGEHLGWGWKVLPPPGLFGWTNVWYQQHGYEWDWKNLAK